MEAEFLREFVTLVVYGNYTKAAAVLNEAQPTLSRHIDSLESEFGTKLVFDDKPFCLTPAGEALLSCASEIVPIYNELLEKMAPFRASKPQRIVIQDLRHLTDVFMLVDAAEQAVRERYPNIVFSLF